MFAPQEVFALLENTRQPEEPARLYRHPVGEIVAHDPSEVLPALRALDTKGALHACGYLAYECGQVLQGLPARETNGPLLHFYLFRDCERLTPAEVGAFLDAQASGDASAVFDARLAEDEAVYTAKIARIKALIEDGETYQVNYTLPYRFCYSGSSLALYRALRAAQKVEFAAYLAFPEAAVLSLSPELFLQREGTHILTRPMKGTAPRGADAEEDAAIRHTLQTDAKTRAENVMIVDLLRNDLGRIARTSSVAVPDLFAIETYETLHQMTSTVTAELRPDTGIADVMTSLFPCGSITGAPKHRTMQIIDTLEPQLRGIYCGALGYIEPDGDFCFNVPIRTIVSTEPGHAVMGTGGGIVHDSSPAAEYAEAALKTRFLHEVNAGLEIIESMRYADGRIGRLDAHLSRLENSARTFAFPFDLAEIAAAIAAYIGKLGADARRLRLALDSRGRLSIEDFAVANIPAAPFVAFSVFTIDGDSIFRRHKTTRRERYEEEYAAAERSGAYEVLFLNQHGRVAEAARHNLFARIDGQLVTPPITEGALPGVLRAELLAQGMAIERCLTPDDLRTAEEILLGNAVRGLIKVQLQD